MHQVDRIWCFSGVSGLPLLVSLESSVVHIDIYDRKDGKYGLCSHLQLCVCWATVKGDKHFAHNFNFFLFMNLIFNFSVTVAASDFSRP